MGVTTGMKGGLASVVLDCAGPLPRTRRCLDALLRHTRRPWELIVVTDREDVDAYLAGICDAAPISVEVVSPCDGDEGFRHAAGLRVACGDYLILIDDGMIATAGWLDGLAALADWDPGIGLIGPMLNDAEPPQRAEGAEGLDHALLRRFSECWKSDHRRQWITTDRLASSCVLMRREIYASVAEPPIGSIGELAARFLDRGLVLAVLRELFVYHDEGAAMLGAGAIGLKPKAFPVGFPPIVVPARSRHSHRQGPRVSLTMIVRDEAHNLPDCLASAEGLFDEVVVIDTGSTDGTAEVARSSGALVIPFPWVDDFSAARNAALEHATGRYAFWLDADDRIDAANRERLRELFAGLDDAEPAAYVMKQVSAGRDGPATGSVADHARLFPARDDLRWTYRVHEQILPAVTAAGLPVRWTGIEIGHLGYVDATTCARKLERNLRLLAEELREKPGNPLVLFNIGWAALYRKDPRSALGYLRASLAGSSPHDALVRKVYALIAQAYQMLGDPESALGACVAGRSLAPDDAGLLFSEAVLRRDRGDLDGAEACWRRILENGRVETFSIVSPGIYGHLTRRKLAALAEGRGDRAGALRLWDEVLAECPVDPEAMRARGRLIGSPSAVATAG